ncbi:VirD4-like conjugal transfer protein, CD1115 family [Actinomyces howellii]|uniref:Conjugal transfer protein traG n=1 Tax=Actinomyces howellii TaxID=52771 RepID=A0A3S4RB62_9ACTO|nr:type IV secretory system conjugative DNA transfer family protein [Actinomyces howellii]VEG28511.1 Conjugal transfer protein traG [Actinomyces howellii]
MTRAKVFIGVVLAALCWWVGNKVSWQVRADSAAGLSPSDIMTRWWYDIVHDPVHLSWSSGDVLAGLGVVAALGLAWAYYYGSRRATRPGEEQGSARWGGSRDIKPFVGDRRQDLLFTRTESLSLDSRRTQRNLNVLVIGSSGSGKSRYFVMPNLYQANTSFVVTDPKGEILSATGSELVRRGYEIRCLNLVDFSASDTFNPLAYFNPGQAEVDCAILTENFIANTTGQKPSTGSDFWEKAERALLTSLISYVYFTKGADGTLLDVVDMLAAMSASEEDEHATSEIDALFAATKECIDDYDAEPQAYDAEAVAMLEGLRFSCSQYNVYTQGAGETKKSIIISLGVRMAPLHMAQVRRILASDSIAADQVGARPTALFLVVPDTHQAFSFLASIFYETFFERNVYLADHNGGRLTVPIQCFMDEFANIGKMPSFERKIAVMRSRGISTAVILQNYSQGKALYRDDWETIVGNCDSLLFLGGNEASTTEFISKRLGKETITQEDSSLQRGTSGSWSRSWRSTGRELLLPDEVARLPGRECLYLLRGVAPFRSRKLDAPQTGVFSYTPRPVVPRARLDDQGESGVETDLPVESGGDASAWLDAAPGSSDEDDVHLAQDDGLPQDEEEALDEDDELTMTITWPDGHVDEETIRMSEISDDEALLAG